MRGQLLDVTIHLSDASIDAAGCSVVARIGYGTPALTVQAAGDPEVQMLVRQLRNRLVAMSSEQHPST